ncbi:MAG: serine hydrolase, partial [Janthinobacterium sp.]
EYCDAAGAHLCGTVHDFSTRLLGGVCGISGLFSHVPDLQRFLRAMLAAASGEQGGVFDAGWVRDSLRVQTGTLSPSRGLFWHPAAGTAPQDDIWCHLGFTGTAMWLSPRRGRYAVLLTNKLYYTREFDRINDIRRPACASAEAAPPATPASLPSCRLGERRPCAAADHPRRRFSEHSDFLQ